MTDGDRPDYSDLLRSPYEQGPDPDRVEGESDIDWRAPVAAAIAGALVVGLFVIYAIVAGADADGEAAVEVTTTTAPPPEPVPSTELPAGFVAANGDVGFRIENVARTPNLQFGIASAAVGGIDSALVAPVDIAYWVIAHDDREIPMDSQRGGTGALGNHTVTFGFPDLPPSPSVLGFPAVGSFSVEETIVLEMGPLPIEIEGYTIDLGADRVVTIDRLVIGDGWGHVEWSTNGTPAKVDVIVTFTGTDDPTTEDVVDETSLTPPHLRPLTFTSGPRSIPPFYNFEYADQLTRSGQPLSADNDPSSIDVSIVATVPGSIGDPIRLPLPGSS